MLRRAFVLFPLTAVAVGCSGFIAGYDESHGDHHHDTYVVIPPRFFPPPGRCRIWIPEWPPRRQSAPGPCRELEWYVPPGGWLVFAPRSYDQFVEVWVHARRFRRDGRPPVVKVLYLDPYTGELVAEEYL